MGADGFERNHIKDCKINDLQILIESGGTESGTISGDSSKDMNKPTVEFILSLVKKLTPAQREELLRRLET